MKKLFAICLLILCGYVSAHIHQFSEDESHFHNKNLSSKRLKFTIDTQPSQVHFEGSRIFLNMNGAFLPIEKLYSEAGQLFAEGFADSDALDSEFIISIKCPKCGDEYLIGQAHTCRN